MVLGIFNLPIGCYLLIFLKILFKIKIFLKYNFYLLNLFKSLRVVSFFFIVFYWISLKSLVVAALLHTQSQGWGQTQLSGQFGVRGTLGRLLSGFSERWVGSFQFLQTMVEGLDVEKGEQST